MELLFNAVLGIIFLVFLVGSFFIRKTSVAADVLRPYGYPMIFSIIGLVLLGFVTLGKIVKKKGEAEAETEDDADAFSKSGAIRCGLILLAVFLYMMLVNYIGFIICTLLFVFCAPLIIGYRKWKVLAVFAVLMTAMLVIFFGKIFFISLPRGIGIFRELSFSLY